MTHIPTWHTFIPNQHTLTCRSINDFVLKRPAYPQMEDILRDQPFLPSIEQAYLGNNPEVKLRPCSITCSSQKSTYSDLST
jgi:hypothetical protein